jgi:hypothetical protein
MKINYKIRRLFHCGTASFFKRDVLQGQSHVVTLCVDYAKNVVPLQSGQVQGLPLEQNYSTA